MANEDLEQKEDQEFGEQHFDVPAKAVWTEEQKAVAGGFVTLGWNGRAHVELGFVPCPDNSRMTELQSETGNGSKGSTAIPGQDGDIPAVLAEELSTAKTLALRAVVAQSPHIALVTIVNHLLSKLRCDESFQRLVCESSLSIRSEHQGLVGHQDEEKRADSRAVQSYKTLVKDVLAEVPNDPGELWQYLMQADTEKLLQLLALATERLVYAVRKPHMADSAQLRASLRSHRSSLDRELHLSPRPTHSPQQYSCPRPVRRCSAPAIPLAPARKLSLKEHTMLPAI
jgi:hypothetical protein